MARINFDLNVPQEIHLRSLDCVEAPSKYDGPAQWKFQATEGEIYVSEAAAGAIGAQRDGTFAVATPQPPTALETQLADSIRLVEARKQAARAAQASPD